MRKKIKRNIQQGDVSLKAINKLPLSLIEIITPEEFTLAIGEATGHCHRIVSKDKDSFQVFKDNDGRYYVKVEKRGVVIEHWNIAANSPAEHKTLPIEPGIYQVNYEQDYNPFRDELKKVKD